MKKCKEDENWKHDNGCKIYTKNLLPIINLKFIKILWFFNRNCLFEFLSYYPNKMFTLFEKYVYDHFQNLISI